MGLKTEAICWGLPEVHICYRWSLLSWLLGIALEDDNVSSILMPELC